MSATVWNVDLDALLTHHALRVLVPYSKTLFFVDCGGTERGMSYDFMHAFEDALNKKLDRGNLRVHAVFIPVSRDKLLPMLLAGEGDVVAANLSVTAERQRLVDFIDPVAAGVRQIIVADPAAPSLRTLDDLAGREMYVAPGSSYAESLTALNERLRARKLPLIKLRQAQRRAESDSQHAQASCAVKFRTQCGGSTMLNAWPANASAARRCNTSATSTSTISPTRWCKMTLRAT